jgi:putative restriction endonuclease
MSDILSYYIKAFAKLNRATLNGLKAPHKPILLLSILQSISIGEITNNKILVTPSLVAKFKDNWNWLVKSDVFKPNFYLPFYHLSSDKFWHLQAFPSKQILLTKSFSIGSFAQLKETVAFGFFDDALFDLLRNGKMREILYQSILHQYFPNASDCRNKSLFENVTNQILSEDSAAYIKRVNGADEEELFVRGGVFKKVVPQQYNYSCCISGMQIICTYDVQMIDACHIIPFSISKNDTITNGISLSPTLHRAFDRGLVTIGNDYRVLISSCFNENEHSTLNSYKGKMISLPKAKDHYPSIESLTWHKENVYKQ